MIIKQSANLNYSEFAWYEVYQHSEKKTIFWEQEAISFFINPSSKIDSL